MHRYAMLILFVVSSMCTGHALALPFSFTEDFRDGSVDDPRLSVTPSPTLVTGSGSAGGLLWAPGNMTDVLSFSFNLAPGEAVESVEITFTDFTDPAPGSFTDFQAEAYNSLMPSPLDAFEDTEPPVVTETKTLDAPLLVGVPLPGALQDPIDRVEIRALEAYIHEMTVFYVPEPTSLGLLATGSLLLVRRRRA